MKDNINTYKKKKSEYMSKNNARKTARTFRNIVI